MGIKTYRPYTPSRRNMSGYDFAEITKSAPEKSLVVSLKKNTAEADPEENIESSTSREEKMESRQLLLVSSPIRTELLTLH